MKSIKLMTAVAFLGWMGSTIAVADGTPPAGNEYGNPTPGASGPTQEQILADAKNIACQGSLCKLFSVNVNKQSFTITTYVGQGMPFMPNSGDGTNIFLGNNGNNGLNTGLGYGLMITWENTKCSKVVNVDRSVYDAITIYMKSLVNMNAKPGEDPTYPAFTPAEQTMILFYTTVMELVKGSTCS